MKLIVGLGNPGMRYEQTRHNVGFLVVDRLAQSHAPGEVARGRFHGAVLEANVNTLKILLLKPGTYMNRSGMSIAEAVNFYKLDPTSDLLVIVDDLALPIGTIRLRAEGSPGGHNGLADIEEKLGTRQYARLRIGIDAPKQSPDFSQVDYVLGRFTPEQLDQLDPALNDAADAAVCWAGEGVTAAMNRYNRKDTTESTPSQP